MAAPLAVCLAVLRPSGRDIVWAAGLLALSVLALAGPSDGFDRLEQAWLVVLTASFALVLASGRPRTFVAAALAAVAAAFVASAALMAVTGRSWGEVLWLAERHYGFQARQLISSLAELQASGSLALPAAVLGGFESSVTMGVRLVARLFPGLVLLQSLAALALAWALYLRIARTPRLEPLGLLATFRFNDHLIWGVAISLLALVLPRLGWLSALGGNLLLFFGGLYAFRGVAVLWAAAATLGIGGPLAALGAAFVTLFLAPVAALAALALGLTDTLMDWRHRLALAVRKP